MATTAHPVAEKRAARAGRRRDNGAVELARFLFEPLRYLDALRDDERDLVPFTLGNLRCHLVTKPEYLKIALHNDDWPPLSRGRLTSLERWYRTGLFLTYGPDHHRQRDELWKPLLRDPALTRIAVERTARRADAWQAGALVDVYRDLRALCWAIDWEALTGEDLDRQPETLAALVTGFDTLGWLPLPFGRARWSWPLPASRKARAASALLDRKIAALVAERRGRADTGDLLAKLVRQAEADGVTSDAELTATFKMWFGADQLHALFCWTLFLLARNPAVEERWHAELDEVLGDRDATADDIAALAYTRQVLKESMRACPPVWGFFRQTTGDYALGDDVVPKGHLMAMSPWFTHRDPRLWPEPQRFDPERWSDGAERPPEISYFPFSAGPYECHGHGLAMQQAVLILATLGRRLTFRAAGPEPSPTARWATEPKGASTMRVARRA